MKALLSATALTAILLSTAGCASDPIDLQPDRNETYDREFVKEFGAPASGHDFSLATTAGLTVTSEHGDRVIVTATIDDTEYLFADCHIPAGTTPLPVTIPNTVTALNVTTSKGKFSVDPNGNLDIDRAEADNRSRKIYETSDGGKYNSLIVSYKDGWENHGPLLIFKVGDFLQKYFSDNPLGKDNTDYSYSYLNDSKTIVHSGCSLFGITKDCYKSSCTYYVFPIWWRKNRYGYKDYKFSLECYPFSQDPNGGYYGLFTNNVSYSNSIPFPQLGYCANPSFSAASVTNSNVSSKFSYDKGSLSKAYDLSNPNMMVATRGVKISTKKPSSKDFNMFILSMQAHDSAHDTYASSTHPSFNDDGYFDVPLDYLFMASTTTKETKLDRSAYQIIDMENQDYYDEGKFLTQKPATKYRDARIIGFNTPASMNADKTPRDYADVILLVICEDNIEERAHIYGFPPQKYEWTIAAEDLGGSHDWDFNDAVFKFTDVIVNMNSANDNWKSAVLSGVYNSPSGRKIEVTPLASGGTMPIYITYNGKVLPESTFPSSGSEMYSVVSQRINETFASAKNGTFIIGTELHKWLGASTHTTALNAGANRNSSLTGKSVSFIQPISSGSSRAVSASSENTSLRGFSVLVDRENKLQVNTLDGDGFTHMPDITLGKDTYLIGAPCEDKGQIAPQMILLDSDWEWPQEGKNIGDAYPSFRDWANTGVWNNWTTKDVDRSKITAKQK